jgi:Tfp pilus assembly protein PilF
MRSSLAVLFLSCAALISSGPAKAESSERWVEVRSTHFVVLTDSNEKQGRKIASQFEQMRSVFHTLLPNATADGDAPIIVLALKDRKSFQTLEPAAYLAKGQLDLAGYFLRTPDKNYILLRLDSQGEHPYATIYHEYTHILMSKAVWMPLWLNEGLAEFYQNTDIHEKDVELGQPSGNDILYLRQNRLIPLATLFNVDHESPYYHEEQKGSVFYAESWALTHYLEITDHDQPVSRIQQYALNLIHHEDSVVAAQHAFGDLNQLQKALNQYVSQGNFKMFGMKTGVTVDESAFQARAIAKPEADAVRADVLIDNNRMPEAEALLTASLHDDPKNALAHEAMGSLKFRQRDIAGARKWYGEAVQLDSHSYLAHYYFAVMSLQEGDTAHDTEIEASLKAAIALNAKFAASYDSLAMFYASRHKKLDEAHMLNVQAVQLEPENLAFRMDGANVLMQAEQYPGAIGVLKAAAQVAKTPEEKAMVQGQIDGLQAYQASVERNRSKAASRGTSVSQGAGATVETSQTTVFRNVNGKMTGTSEDASAGPKYPREDAKGPHHTVSGVIQRVECSYPNVLAFSLEQPGKTIRLYNNNFYKIAFTVGNYTQTADIQPCTTIEGMKAKVIYAESTDKTAAGQVLAIELNK